jgi:serine/threonine-protein kinase RsbW
LITKKIEIKSQRSEILKIESLLDDINKEFGLADEKYVNLQIAISEALINAIIHGNKENPQKKVFIEITYDENFITVKIKDEGEGFDLNKIPDPTNQENIFKEHGRGLFIMKSLVDKFECYPGEEGTEFSLTVFRV